MQLYNRVVLDSIEREKKGTDYYCTGADKVLLQTLLEEINEFCGTGFRYLAELDAFTIPGSGGIIAKYIQRFSSESVRGYLLSQLVSDKIKDCDIIILHMYMHFKNSSEYISAPGVPAPAHIYVRYDNAFRALKPKRLKSELLRLAYNPRDAFYLPFTMRMLGSWKIPELKELFLSYASNGSITPQDVGLSNGDTAHFPPFDFIRRELRFLAIDALKYYPSDTIYDVISQYIDDPDPGIRVAVKRTLKVLLKAIKTRDGFA